MQSGAGSWLVSSCTRLRYDIIAAAPGRLWPFTGLLFIGLLIVGLEPEPSSQLLIEAFFIEALFPLVVGLVSYRLVLVDRDAHRLAFLKTRESLSRMWGHRLVSLMIGVFPLLGMMWLGWLLMEKSVPSFATTLLAFGTPTLALVSVGGMIAFLTRHISAGDLVLVFWWGFCFLSYRAAYDILGPFYLFPLWYTLRTGRDMGIQASPRWMSIAVSLAFLVICFVLLEREE